MIKKKEKNLNKSKMKGCSKRQYIYYGGEEKIGCFGSSQDLPLPSSDQGSLKAKWSIGNRME